jgi:hypothetical protein
MLDYFYGPYYWKDYDEHYDEGYYDDQDYYEEFDEKYYEAEECMAQPFGNEGYNNNGLENLYEDLYGSYGYYPMRPLYQMFPYLGKSNLPIYPIPPMYNSYSAYYLNPVYGRHNGYSMNHT